MQLNDIKVTIAIASYNNASYIERCVLSVINQTYSNLEILIVDDGSKDNTLEIISKYQKDNRVVIIEKENDGLSSVRQRALEEACGDYICFVDADDYLLPTYVDKMLNKLIEDNSDICICSTRFEDESGARLERLSKGFACEDSITPFQTTASQFSTLNNLQIAALHLSDSWNKMYKIVSIRSYGVEFSMPKGLNGSDTMFNRLVALHAPLYSSISDELYSHVIYQESAVHRKKKDLLSTYQIITEKSILESKKLGIYDDVKKYIETNYLSNLCEVLIDENKESVGYISFVRQLNILKKKHLDFTKEYEINPFQMCCNCSVVEKSILVAFQTATIGLPVLLGIGKFLKNFKLMS